MQTLEYWFCVQSKPGKEAYALAHLERQGFECFLPMLRSKRMYRGKLQWVTSSMFLRYLFIRECADITTVRSTLGVANLVQFGSSPGRIHDQIIQQIRAHCQDNVFTLPEDKLCPGDKVHVVDGPYRGVDAIFQRPTSQEERVIILLEIMESYVPAEIAREQVIKSKYD